jgi:hypothetical protein
MRRGCRKVTDAGSRLLLRWFCYGREALTRREIQSQGMVRQYGQRLGLWPAESFGQCLQFQVSVLGIVPPFGVAMLHKANDCLQVPEGCDTSARQVPPEAIVPGGGKATQAAKGLDQSLTDRYDLAR